MGVDTVRLTVYSSLGLKPSVCFQPRRRGAAVVRHLQQHVQHAVSHSGRALQAAQERRAEDNRQDPEEVRRGAGGERRQVQQVLQHHRHEVGIPEVVGYRRS